MAWSMIPVIGKVVAVGPVELAPHDTTYQYVVILKKDGTCRDFADVCAIPVLSGLLQRDAAGTFVFCESPDECRLSFVYRDDGVSQVDYEALQVYFDQD
jgi:hypothetical protein